MYKDVISYQLADGISKERLLEVAAAVVDGWMKNQKGFVKWEIHEQSEGEFVDIVYWETEQHAKDSEKDMMNVPNAADWYACYKEGSIQSKNIHLIKSF